MSAVSFDNAMRTRYSADFIITTPGLGFSVHTGGVTGELWAIASRSYVGVRLADAPLLFTLVWASNA
jgi:hypothetical protein